MTTATDICIICETAKPKYGSYCEECLDRELENEPSENIEAAEELYNKLKAL